MEVDGGANAAERPAVPFAVLDRAASIVVHASLVLFAMFRLCFFARDSPVASAAVRDRRAKTPPTAVDRSHLSPTMMPMFSLTDISFFAAVVSAGRWL